MMIPDDKKAGYRWKEGRRDGGVEENVVWDLASYETRNKESNEDKSVCDGKSGDIS